MVGSKRSSNWQVGIDRPRRLSIERSDLGASLRDVLRLPTDTRGNSTASFMTSWCNGAPGIGLVRLWHPRRDAEPDVQHERAIALKVTQAFVEADVDDVCCGSMGRAAFLWDYGQLFGSEYERQAAEQIATSVLNEAGDKV